MKKKIIATVSAAISVVGIVFLLTTGKKDGLISKLKRPDYSKSDITYDLVVEADKTEYDIHIPVSSVKIPDNEIQKCFDDAYEIICEEIKGENDSLQYVVEDLNFIDEIEKYGMTVDYTMDNYDLIDCFGSVKNAEADKKGNNCIIHANISYDNLSQEYDIPVTVYPPNYTEEEEFLACLEKQIEKNNQDNRENEYLELPKEVNGTKLEFKGQEESRWPIAVFIFLMIVLIIYYKKVILERNLRLKKEEQMQMDYSEIVSKLSLLMGAGMNGLGAFSKIAYDYKEARKNGKEKQRYAYDEIVTCCNKIASGCSEANAYSQFGKACRIHCYIKLGSLMAQNIKKGGEGFTAMLHDEATQAFIERKALARRAGETAGTKLLLPMGMMLGIVLVIIIVPAFMSF